MTTTPYVKDLKSYAEFEPAVILRSAEVPVVIDFWAPWCGPCKVLGPIIEQEVAALGGKVELIKVNTDELPEIAQSFGIQGIPAVKAVRNGEIVAEFTGAQPAEAVKKFLNALVPAETLTGFEAAEAAFKAGDFALAEATVRPLLSDPELSDKSRILLARSLVGLGRAIEVPAVLEPLDDTSLLFDQKQSLLRLLAFAVDAAAYGGEEKARAAVAADPKDLEARFALASALAARHATSEALEEFLEVVSRSRKFRDDGARKAMVALFDQLSGAPDGAELVYAFRRRLQIVL